LAGRWQVGLPGGSVIGNPRLAGFVGHAAEPSPQYRYNSDL
jgi:hypothetical protein